MTKARILWRRLSLYAPRVHATIDEELLQVSMFR